MASPTNEISESIKEGFISFKDGIISFINQLIPKGIEVQFVFFISIIIAIIVTRWQKPNRPYIYGTVGALLLFMSFRFLGVGG